MGIENAGLDLSEQAKLKVTTAGEAGYRGAWDSSKSSPNHEASPEMVRDAAINSADLDELTDAVTRLENTVNPDAVTLEALAKLRSRIDEVIQRHQN
ncbi:MAG: hypothetical protein KBA91_03945 [Candidatus Moranbacteria bacterium]|jgi:hypothetical protein|nr:hypothetical protein [Candidatus Moranbacteria bacterium]